MTSRQVASTLCVVCFAFSASAISQSSQDMVDIKNSSELRELFSNKTFKGSYGVAHYRSDGKGQFVPSGRKPEPRTWVVKGEDQVCISTTGANYTSNDCWRFQRHRKNPAWITQQRDSDSATLMFTVEDGIPKF